MGSRMESCRDVRKYAAPRFSRALLVIALVLIGPAEARAQQPAYQPPATLLPGIEVPATP